MIKYNNLNINDWCHNNSDISKVYHNGAVCYYKIASEKPPTPHDYSQDYLTFRALESGTFKFSGNSVDYSVDNGTTWTSLASNTSSPTVSAGNKIMWKATGLTPTSSGIGKFSSTGSFEVEGNVMSLYFGDNFSGQTDLTGKNYAFYGLFSHCTGMTSAVNLVLPATTLTTYCYSYMFSSCTSLTTAPTLLATTLAKYCYSYMFKGCTSLTTAPELPATTLSDFCYQGMFNGCTSLTTAPTLLATTLVNGCYINMFDGCSNLTGITCLATNISAQNCTYRWVNGVAASGTFTKAASMSSWTTGTSGIPSGWTVVNDKNNDTPPELVGGDDGGYEELE